MQPLEYVDNEISGQTGLVEELCGVEIHGIDSNILWP